MKRFDPRRRHEPVLDGPDGAVVGRLTVEAPMQHGQQGILEQIQ